MISKYDAPLKGTQLLGEVADSGSEAGNHKVSQFGFVRKKSSTEENMGTFDLVKSTPNRMREELSIYPDFFE